MNVRRIVPDIASSDPSAGRDFYVEVLGLEVTMDMDWVVTLVSPSNPTAQLTIVRPASGLQPDYTVEVDDVDACHARAIDRGTQILYPLTSEQWGVRRFFVRDPNGKIANVMSHSAKPGEQLA